LEGTPTAAEALQTNTITITADNGIGTFAMQTIVVGPSAPAFMNSIPNLTAEVGPRFEFRIPAGGPPMPTLSMTGNPTWLSIVSGRIEGYPGELDSGVTSTITVTANNGFGAPATRTFTVFVPYPPTLINAIAGETLSLTLDPGPVPAHSFVGGSPFPSWLSIYGDVLTGKPPLTTSGTVVAAEIDVLSGVVPSDTQTHYFLVAFNPKDVTRDKAIDIVDVQRLVNLILALSVPAYASEGDVNADSAVDVVDVQAVVNKILSP